ncbi:hypothetical protein EGT07_03045 [Herbaspirillum sp. HC18]|nr:hypothetical protein EGT07_03045 [Herbaspirillum sp. HC18]
MGRSAGLKHIVKLVLASTWLLLSATAYAANSGQQDAESRYRDERTACAGIQDSESRAACLRDAAAAREAAKRGKLDEGQGSYEQNALARCEALPADERDNCKRRARGEGEARGSVSGGGIIREYRELTLPSVTPQGQ